MPGLNPPQSEAVSTLTGPLLVLAGAGTGKTRVVTFRIANLIKNGIQPERILGVTFTNKAATEMKERIGSLLSKQRKKLRPEISTFHSLCVKILRRRITLLGYPAHYLILDRGEQETIAKTVLREIRIADGQVKPSELLWQISTWKSKSIRPKKATSTAETDKEHLCAIAYQRYQKTIKMRGAVDFDDLLLLTEELFQNNENARQEEADRFDHILIDEYQDTNQSQYEIVKSLSQDHRNLCVVGDDDQSIYAWRGAEVEHILSFQKDWPDAKVVRLQENYRSTGKILQLANKLIRFNKNRYEKKLIAARPDGLDPPILQFPNETKEAEEVVFSIRRRLQEPGIDPRDIAILFRTNEQPRPFEVELRKAKIPYILLGGQSFFDRKEVRDIMAYLKVIAVPSDEVSLLRVINTPTRGVGPKIIERLVSDSIENEQTIWKTLVNADQLEGLSAKAKETLSRFVKLMKRFQKRFETENLANVARDLVLDINYKAELQKHYHSEEERELKMNSVEEVINALSSYITRNPKSSLIEFLQDSLLDDRDIDNEKDDKLKQNSIALLTMHSAKGLEYPEVYMVGLEEGILPHRRSVETDGEAIDEERRLCYVGLTRAQERLNLSLCLTRLKWGKARESHPSRFLFEMIGKADNPADIKTQKKTNKRNSSRPKRPTGK